MGQRCRVCIHPQVKEIDAGLKAEVSVSELSRQFHLTHWGIMRHRDKHAGPPPRKARPKVLGERLKVDRRPNRPPTPPEVEAEAKEHFLNGFATSGDFVGSAQTAGVTRSTIQVWLEHDEEFGVRFHQAKAAVIDQLEATALDRAMHGAKLVREVWRGDKMVERIIEWRPQEMTVLKLLQALKPEVYAEKLQVTQTQIVKTVDADAWVAV